MTWITMAMLKDQFEVEQATLFQTVTCLIVLRNDNRKAFGELFEKCKNPNYALSDSKQILRKWQFINENDQVDADIKKIVLNSIKKNGKLLLFINPIQSTRVCFRERL